MFSPLRNRFGTPGVISVIALVFAMLGGAYAANDSGEGKATASAVKKGPRGPRGPRGKTGPAGPAGPQGPAGALGAKGDTGAAGANGKDGAAGATGATGNNGAKGATGATGATGSTGATGATGATGFSGFTATLPSGETETGAWGLQTTSASEGIGQADVSFPIPLAAPIAGASTHAINIGDPVPAACDDGDSGNGAPSAANPEADPGHLCVWAGRVDAVTTIVFFTIKDPTSAALGASRTGALIFVGVLNEGDVQVGGTFAVTAP